jgi:hypothetical protein
LTTALSLWKNGAESGYNPLMTNFVHLHVHSDFSLLDGAALAEDAAAK